MATTKPRPNSQDLDSQDDGVLCIKTDSDPESDHTSCQSATYEDEPQDELKINTSAITSASTYYSIMADADADTVFIQPPPYTVPLLPEGGSTHTILNNPTVTLTNWAADATEPKANPNGLDRHHGDKQLMAAHRKVDEEKASLVQTSRKSVALLSKEKDASVPTDQDKTSMEDTGGLKETCYNPSQQHQPAKTTGVEESHGMPEEILTEGHENWRGTEVAKDSFPQQVPSGTEHDYENETQIDKKEDKAISEEIIPENIHCSGVIMSSPTLNNNHSETWQPSELCKRNQNWMEEANNQPQPAEIPTQVSNNNEDIADIRCLDHNFTTYSWKRSQSGTEETEPKLTISGHFEETVSAGRQRDESRRIATDIQQGERLLQRLQQVQLRQDVHTLESSHGAREVVQEVRSYEQSVGEIKVEDMTEREESLTHEREESRLDVDGEKGEINLTEGVENESATVLEEPEHHMISPKETSDSESDDDQSDSNCVPVGASHIDPSEITSSPIPSPSLHHRLSAAETAIEKQLHAAAQKKQNLQRAGGVCNLADNPDVLEIPFKTNILLDTTTVAPPCHRHAWQFSEQKMHKEISQEIQRELVLVNQGKIPGGYSKGEVRQLKETKLLFEAFQQYNMEGPTRHRKSPSSVMKGQIYPTVLERTRSLEMFSLKSRPISRAHSLRLHKSNSDMEKSLRSKGPTVGSNKTCLHPHWKEERNVCLYRSMDSISTNMTTVEAGKTGHSKTSQESLIITQNPFYKLRPALALQPEVERDIREAKEREEELRRQRCTLYGEDRPRSEDREVSHYTPSLKPGRFGIFDL